MAKFVRSIFTIGASAVLLALAARAVGANGALTFARVGSLGNNAYLVPTFQHVAVARESVLFFGRPVDLSLNPQRTTLAIKTSHGLVFVDTRTFKIVQVLQLPKLNVDFPLHLGGNAPAGLMWNRSGSEVWETDAFTSLHGARKAKDGRFTWTDAITLPFPRASIVKRTDVNSVNTLGPAPISVVQGSGSAVWVTLSRNNTIALVDLTRHKAIAQVRVGVAPYGIASAHNKVYVSNWGGAVPDRGSPSADSSGSLVSIDPNTGVANSGTVSVIDAETRRVLREVEVGLHPSAIVSSADGRYVYVANSNSDTVSVIDTTTDVVARTLDLRQAGAKPGLAPVALALDADDTRLYAAEGGVNAVASIDLQTGDVVSSLATAWYPSAIVRTTNGTIYVASLKGVGSRGKDLGLPLTVNLDRKGGYNSYDYAGVVQAASAESWRRSESVAEGSAADTSLLPRIFHHVVYIIKENHTYDDIYGDLNGGNGDRRLCLFCNPITPNQHALAKGFGIFDNFYVNGILSADGHNWTDEGYATDYMERNMSGWARSYPSAGGDPLAYSPAGFIWNRVVSAGLEFRDYGEFTPDLRAFTVDGKPHAVTWSDAYADYVHGTHRVAWRQEVDIGSLRPYVNMKYPSFSLRVSDQYRASVFIREFGEYVTRGRLPSLILLALPNDHTAYSTPGFPEPAAFAADNDLALGRIVSAISRSPFWSDTVIFVVEDDAQDGTDHVDGHRTAALVISAHNKPGVIDSHFYNQTSILHTIELILGLPAMTRFDENAPAIVYPFQVGADVRPYNAVPNRIPLNELNPPVAALSGRNREYALDSERIHVDQEDTEDPDVARTILRGAATGP